MEYLGYIIWYSLPSNKTVRVSELEGFRDLDPLIKLPKAPSKKNLFKRVCKEVAWKENGVKYFFESGVETKRKISRTLVKQWKPHQKPKVTQVLGTVTLNLKTGTLSSNPEDLDDEQHKNFSKAWGKVNEGMQLEKTVDHMAIRSLIKEIVENKLQGIWVTSGTYFIEPKHADRLQKLKNVVAGLNITFHVLPVVDEPEQRAMVENAYLEKVLDVFEVFKEELLVLPPNPSAYKVKKLKSYIRDIKILEPKANIKQPISELMETSLKSKLS